MTIFSVITFAVTIFFVGLLIKLLIDVGRRKERENVLQAEERLANKRRALQKELNEAYKKANLPDDWGSVSKLRDEKGPIRMPDPKG